MKNQSIKQLKDGRNKVADRENRFMEIKCSASCKDHSELPVLEVMEGRGEWGQRGDRRTKQCVILHRKELGCSNGISLL